MELAPKQTKQILPRGANMKGKATRKPPQIIFSEGKPRAVIPDIDAGRCLERLDFWQDKSSCDTIFYRNPTDLYH
jgi:hypothetical protein